MRVKPVWLWIVVALFLSTLFIQKENIVTAVSGSLFVLLVPGFLLGRALIRRTGGAGEMAVIAIALSLTIAGLSGLILGVIHEIGRAQSLVMLLAVSCGSVWLSSRRDPHLLYVPTPGPDQFRKLVPLAIAVLVCGLVLAGAFALDANSADVQAKESSVALAAVREGTSLSVQVIAGDSVAFTGTLRVEATSSINASWRIRSLAPGHVRVIDLRHAPIGRVRLTLSGNSGVSRVLVTSPGTTYPGGQS